MNHQKRGSQIYEFICKIFRQISGIAENFKDLTLYRANTIALNCIE